ncbi:MAG: Na+/H+ antiporter subunit E [Lachnospiraceae bacterium]|nr:Na+/H+ antiporter subunit E [Lachnospiraceae bacterium]
MYFLIFLFWIVLNGRITAETVLLGLGLTALLGLFLRILLGYTIRKDLRVLRKSPYFAAFLFVLLFEIMKANLAVIRLISRKEKTLQPVLVTFDSDLRTDFCRYLFANSITLTPGTITVEADEDVFTVHCLSERLLDCSDSNVLLKLLRKMEA